MFGTHRKNLNSEQVILLKVDPKRYATKVSVAVNKIILLLLVAVTRRGEKIKKSLPNIFFTFLTPVVGVRYRAYQLTMG